MSTRELIEAVSEPERVGVVRLDGSFNAPEVIKRSDYDALRAATLAVLDELIGKCEMCLDGDLVRRPAPPVPCPRCTNARALRERLKP